MRYLGELTRSAFVWTRRAKEKQEVKPKQGESMKSKRKTDKFRIIFRFLKGNIRFLVGTLVFSVLFTACNALIPQIVKYTADHILVLDGIPDGLNVRQALLLAAILVVSTGSAVLAEWLYDHFMHKPNTIGDFSAVVTGLLIGMNMPAGIPLWIPALGSIFAIIVVKQLFGGLGQNFMNPGPCCPLFPYDFLCGKNDGLFRI